MLRPMGDLLLRVADDDGARAAYEGALGIFRDIRERLGEANTLRSMGDLFFRVGDDDGARAAYEEALAIYQDIRERVGEANTLRGIGDLQSRLSDDEGAIAAYHQALMIQQEVRDSNGEGVTYLSLGQHEIGQGRSALAALDLERAAEMFRSGGDASGQVCALSAQAAAFERLGLQGAAAAALAVAARIGAGIGIDEPAQALKRLLAHIAEGAPDGIEHVRQLQERLEQDPEAMRQTALAALNHGRHDQAAAE